jgi:hypothetical protein
VRKPKKGAKAELDRGYRIADENIGKFMDSLEGYLESGSATELAESLNEALTTFLKSRKADLDRTKSELSAGNVAFKMLRADGIIDGLKAIVRKARNLSYTER